MELWIARASNLPVPSRRAMIERSESKTAMRAQALAGEEDAILEQVLDLIPASIAGIAEFWHQAAA